MRGAQSQGRTGSDSVPVPSDSPVRTTSASRSASDAIASITETTTAVLSKIGAVYRFVTNAAAAFFASAFAPSSSGLAAKAQSDTPGTASAETKHVDSSKAQTNTTGTEQL